MTASFAAFPVAVSVAVPVALLCAASASLAQTLHVFPRPSQTTSITVSAVSNTGVITGIYNQGALDRFVYRWNPTQLDNPFVSLPSPGPGATVTGIAAASGQTLLANVPPLSSSTWNGATITSLPALPDAYIPAQPVNQRLRLAGITADGSRVFGSYSHNDSMPPGLAYYSIPWTWSAATGYTQLPTPPADRPMPIGGPYGVLVNNSRNGQHAAGFASSTSIRSLPTTWSLGPLGWSYTTLPFPTDVPGTIVTDTFDFGHNTVSAISDDGRIAIGSVRYRDSASNTLFLDVRWVDGVVTHTRLNGRITDTAQSAQMTADGSLILIDSRTNSSLIWNADGSTTPLRSYLESFGVTFPSDATFWSVSMSADGRTFAGLLTAPSQGWTSSHPWTVTIPSPAALPILAISLLAARRRRH